MYFVKKTGTLSFMLEKPVTGGHSVDSPTVPRRAKPKGRASRFLIILIASLLVGNALIGERGLVSMIRADREFKSLSRTLVTLRAENKGLRDQVRDLQEEPRAIEELAREELGLIRPGEKLIIVTTESAPVLNSHSRMLSSSP